MIGAIVQARMGSSRLPGKAMMKINGIPILEIILRELKLCKTLDRIILLTTFKEQDDCLCATAKECGVKVHRSSFDLLKGFSICAKENGLKHIVRITGDCPLTNHSLVDFMVRFHLGSKADYSSNNHPVRLVPKGFDVEVFKAKTLYIADEFVISDPYCREHVCPSFYFYPETFTVKQPTENYSVDTKEDLTRIRRLIKC